MKQQILVDSAKEYYEMGSFAQKSNKPNSAVILFFKAVIALADLYLLQKTGTTPSSHTERFKRTKAEFPKLYSILDKNFPFYQDNYTQKMSLELAEVILDDVKELAQETNTQL